MLLPVFTPSAVGQRHHQREDISFCSARRRSVCFYALEQPIMPNEVCHKGIWALICTPVVSSNIWKPLKTFNPYLVNLFLTLRHTTTFPFLRQQWREMERMDAGRKEQKIGEANLEAVYVVLSSFLSRLLRIVVLHVMTFTRPRGQRQQTP